MRGLIGFAHWWWDQVDAAVRSTLWDLEHALLPQEDKP